ncbi:MAG: site-2 protease family protein [Gemmatimonadaceae bacterium]|nr:site-2 protease family protein [Gemmatimonadaceae bacterium]
MVAPVLLFSMVAHEYAHGYAALLQGDPTARNLGRLSWNPIRHIDPFMTILVPLVLFLTKAPFLFGGAKPVPVNPRLYRNYRRGDIIVSLAGIAVNLALVPVCLVLVVAMGLLGRGLPVLNDSAALLQVMFLSGIWINLGLAVFNLLPIPPLDGSHVIRHLLPPAWELQYRRLYNAGFIVLLVFLTFGRPILNLWFKPVYFIGGLATDLVEPLLLLSKWTT